MATGGERDTDVRKGEDFRHTCGLCMEPYRGRQPKLLPCFHTFCLPCLTALAASATTTPKVDNDNKAGKKETDDQQQNKEAAEKANNDEEKKLDEGESGNGDGSTAAVFLCPTCRSRVTVPPGGVASLQSNFYLDHEDEASAPRPVPCDMCEEGQKQDAAHACDKCQKRMCRACRRLHDMFTNPKVHRVRPLGPQDQPSQRPNAEIKMCPVHPDQNLVMHCKKCDVSICLLCKLTSHEGHETEDVAVAVKRSKEELKELRVKVNQQMQVVGAMLDRLEKDERELARQKQEATSEVRARYDNVILWVTRARDEVLENMAAMEQKVLRDLQTQKKSARSTMETFTVLEDRAMNVLNSKADVVTLKNDFKSALLDEESLTEYRQRVAREDSCFFPVTSDASSVELDLLRAYIGQINEDDANTPRKGLVGRLEELSKRVTDTETKIEEMTARSSDIETRMMSQIQNTARLVAFHALLCRNEMNTAAGQTLIFKGVRSNEGNCYDVNRGVFTAPCDGTYAFFTTVRSAEEGELSSVKLLVDDDEYAYAYGTKDSVGSTHVCVKLKSGSRVFVRVGLDKCDFRDTAFSGVLVQAAV